jgi:murein DD-endopeptidase MepM/ murein hydrolase activator NlpD
VVLTPVIARALAEPIPVPATDNKVHLAYELVVTNRVASAVTVQSVRASAGDRTLFDVSGDALTPWMRVFGAKDPGHELGPGQGGLIFFDATVDNAGQVPQRIEHAIALDIAQPSPPLLPASLTEHVATTPVDQQTPITIKPPLDGQHWLDGDGCCTVGAHRGAVSPLNGALYAPERFAIDYIQLDESGHLFTGDKSKLDSYKYFGAAVHAVADGAVVGVVTNLPEQTPGTHPTGLPLEQYGGNHIVEDLGGGHYAFYAHLQPDAGVKVKVGDTVKTGQVIGLVGNSGNSDSPHLHFHIMNGPDPLASDGLPFEIDSFTLEAHIPSEDNLYQLLDGAAAEYQPDITAGQRHAQSPLTGDVMTYRANG